MPLRKRHDKHRQLWNLNKGEQYKSTRNGTGDLTPVTPKYGMTIKGCVKVGPPVRG